MAFCNSCGASINSSDKFCPKCGATAQSGTAIPVAGSAPAGMAPAAKSSSGSKTILIVVLVIVGFIVLGIAGLGIVGWQIARHSRVQKDGDQVKVETPFGTMESTNNADDALKKLGIEVYPGAHSQKGAAVTSFAGMHTVTAPYESDDSADKVADFYKARFPNANVSVSDSDHYTIVSTDKNAVTTITVEARNGTTTFVITNVTK